MTLLAKNLLLIAVGVFLVACMWQWQRYQIEELRERLTKQAIAELPPAEQHEAFPVIVHFEGVVRGADSRRLVGHRGIWGAFIRE